MPSQRQQTLLRLPPDIRRDLERYARENDLTITAAAVRLLRAGLDKDAEGKAFWAQFAPRLR